MSALPKHEPYTVADLPEDTAGARFEIIDGSLHVSPTPTVGHQLMAQMLSGHLQRQSPGDLIAVASGLGVSTAQDSYMVPDVTVVNRAVVRQDLTVHPRDVLLVVEILSPSTRRMDLGIKPHVYADWGIPHLWLLNQDTGVKAARHAAEERFQPAPMWAINAYHAFLGEWSTSGE